MGKHQLPNAEQVRALLTASAETMLVPEVAIAMRDLRDIIRTVDDDPNLLVAVLTFIAATTGCTSASPDEGNSAEALQLSILRSTYATHAIHNRTLH